MASRQHLTLILTILLLLGVSSVNAEIAGTEDAAHIDQKMQEIAASVMSPYCPGKLLRDCTSSSATELKEKIQSRLSAGESAEQITDSLLTLYGDQLLAAPRVSGFGLVAWVTPFAFLLIGGAIFLLWRRSKSATQHDAATHNTDALSPEARAKVTRALLE